MIPTVTTVIIKAKNTVFISEYNAPDDFEELIAVNHKLLLNKKTNLNRVEKLFKFVENKIGE